MSQDEASRRKSDVVNERIEQKLDDFIKLADERWKGHIDWSDKTTADHEKRLKMLEDLLRSIDRPVKWVGWTVTIFLSGMLLYMGDTFARFVWKSWRP